jgi:hypothetical protein
MNGGLNWWPFMIPNFHSEYHILQAVKTVKAVFLLSKKNQIYPNYESAKVKQLI